MAHDRFDEHYSFNVLGFIQLLYDTTCVNSDFWVKPVWGLGCGMYLPLPGYDKHGRKVVLMRAGPSDPDTMKKDDEFKTSTMIMEAAMEGDQQAVIRGMVLIQDLEGMTLAKTLGFTPAVAKRAMTVWQDAYPTRPKV